MNEDGAVKILHIVAGAGQGGAVGGAADDWRVAGHGAADSGGAAAGHARAAV